MDRVRITKLILWAIAGLAASVALTRFVFGLGVTTNLTDTTPWGFWIGFDVMGGVALAAGGFVITAIVYMMKREEFHPIVKPAVLTAFLGYIAVILGLMVDLGLPWNIWHMMIFWNPHSPLFEVGWCVMLYTTVLLLEFSPVPLEKASRYARIRDFLMRYRFWLVLLGIMLSTLHQSSLGSLFLIMPFKLHALWYSEILPIMFFISAVGLGLSMVSLESITTSWLYRRRPETHLVAKLCRVAVWVLALYLVVKLVEIAVTDGLARIFDGSWESNLFIIEMLISVVIPIILFSIPRVRNHTAGQWIGSLMVVVGMVFNRINVGGLSMLRATGDSYVPSWMEIVISAGVVSLVGLVFLFVLEKFRVWDRPPADPDEDPHALPHFDRTSEVWLGTPSMASRTVYSLAFILAMAVGLALIPDTAIHSGGVEHVSVWQARGGDTLYIDGNRDSQGVSFSHQRHIDSLGGNTSCVRCHHMNLPQDKQSGCHHCHSSMYEPFDAFRHDWHNSPDGANLSCTDCHVDGSERSRDNAKKCDACHLDLVPHDALFQPSQYVAPAYVDAMHGLCVACHEDIARQRPEKANLALCSGCHETEVKQFLTADVWEKHLDRKFNRVTVPVMIEDETEE